MSAQAHGTSGVEGSVNMFDPIYALDFDVPFPVADLVYRNRFEL